MSEELIDKDNISLGLLESLFDKWCLYDDEIDYEVMIEDDTWILIKGRYKTLLTPFPEQGIITFESRFNASPSVSKSDLIHYANEINAKKIVIRAFVPDSKHGV